MDFNILIGALAYCVIVFFVCLLFPSKKESRSYGSNEQLIERLEKLEGQKEDLHNYQKVDTFTKTETRYESLSYFVICTIQDTERLKANKEVEGHFITEEVKYEKLFCSTHGDYKDLVVDRTEISRETRYREKKPVVPESSAPKSSPVLIAIWVAIIIILVYGFVVFTS